MAMEDSTPFRVKLSSAIRIVLVDAETENRLLGSILCGPSFVVSEGDLPSAVKNGLYLHDISSSQLAILSMSPNEITIGVKSNNDRHEEIFTREASVVFVERQASDPGGCLMEGLVLVSENDVNGIYRERVRSAIPASNDGSSRSLLGDDEACLQFRCVYARSDENGIYWYKSRSELLTSGSNISGGFAFSDVVAIRQSPTPFEFDREEYVASFNSSIEFLLKTGSTVVFALAFPFPLVQWLYCAHAALRLPRMSLSVSQMGTWNAVLEDGFSIGSPLIVECFQVSALSPRIGIVLSRGCGGTIIDTCAHDGIERRVNRLDSRRHASNYPVNHSRSRHPSTTQGLTSRRSSMISAASVTREGFATRDFTLSNGRATAGSTSFFTASHVREGSVVSASSSLMSIVGTSSSLPEVAPTSADFKEPEIFLDGEATEIQSGDLFLKIDSHWVMDWDWRETETLLRSLSSKRPLEFLVGRCEPLANLAGSKQLLLKAKQVQLLLSSWALKLGLNSNQPAITTSPVTITSAAMRTAPALIGGGLAAQPMHRPILEIDSKDARRRAETRQLFRRQTARLNPSGVTLDSSAGSRTTMNKDPARGESNAHQTSKKPLGVVSKSVEHSKVAPGNMEDGADKFKMVSPSSSSTGVAGAGESGLGRMREESDGGGPQRSSARLSLLADARNVSYTALRSVAARSLPSALAKTKSSSTLATGDKKKKGRESMIDVSAPSTRALPLLNPLVDQLTKADSAAKREEIASLLLTLTNDKLNKPTAGPVCIPALIEGCADSSPLVQERCAGALWNLSDIRENALIIARMGGVQALIRLLNTGNEFAKEEACGALWTIAEDETNVPLLILTGAMEPLMQILAKMDTSSGYLQENASGCVWTLSTSPSARKLLREDRRTMFSLLMLLREGDYVTKENVLGILANIFAEETDDDSRQTFLQGKGAQKLVQAIMFGRSEPVKRNAVTCLIEFVRNRSDLSSLVASEGAITALLKLLLQAQENSTKIKAAEGLKILAQVPENAIQLSELGSVPEVLRMLEQAKKSREERRPREDEEERKVKAIVTMDANIHPEDMLTQKRYVHFDSAVLDSGLDKMIASLSERDRLVRDNDGVIGVVETSNTPCGAAGERLPSQSVDLQIDMGSNSSDAGPS